MNGITAWTWAAALASALGTLPAVAGEGGWLAPLVVLPLVLGLERIRYPADKGGFAAEACRVLGGKGGRALTIIYMVWAVVLGGIQLKGSARRVETAVTFGGAPWLVAAALILLAVWFARGRPAACARCMAVMLGGLLAFLAVLAVPALAQMRWEDLPSPGIGGGDLGRALVGTLGVLCVRMYGGFLPEREHRVPARYPVAVCVVLALLLKAVGGVLGPELVAGLEDPLLTLFRNVEINGAFRRAESLLAAGLLAADLALLTLLLWAVRYGAQQLWRAEHSRYVSAAVAAAMLLCALWPVQEVYVEAFRQRVVPGVNLALGLAVPLAVMLFDRIKTGKEGAHIVPGEGENGIY